MAGLSNRDRAFTVAAIIVVAVLVGMAAHPAAGSGAVLAPVTPVMVLVQTLAWLVIAADILVTAVIAHSLWSERKSFVIGRQKRSPLVYLSILLPSMIAAMVILYLPPGSIARGAALSGLLAGPGGRLPAATRLAAASGGAGVMWISLLLAGLVLVLFLGWLFWGGTKRPLPIERPAPAPQEAVVEVLEATMDALRAISDPRRAIIAAYSAMEGAMARAGLARRPAEAPMEFLARVLRSALDISADATSLTHLFEVAKFSDHRVDEAMRTDALLALARIRDQLAATTVA